MQKFSKSQPPAFLLTIDVEEWFQVENLRPWVSPSVWNHKDSRVEFATQKLLDLFDAVKTKVHATFFVLGCIAEKHPRLIHEIKSRGHEIASHGYHHKLNNKMDPKELIEDLHLSKKILEDLIGDQVRGYRAPSFSVDDAILQAVQSAGYSYDSSYNSFELNSRYGKIKTNGMQSNGIAYRIDDGFFELPISNLTMLGRNVPWGGGGYFRLIPAGLFRIGIRLIMKQKYDYLMYLHPWEVDPHQPRLKQASGLPAFRHYFNLNRTYARLKKLINNFPTCQFKTCTQYLTTMTGTGLD